MSESVVSQIMVCFTSFVSQTLLTKMTVVGVDEHTQDTPEEETTGADSNENEETDPTPVDEETPEVVLKVNDPYPARKYQHICATLKGEYPDKWQELEDERIELGLDSIRDLPDLTRHKEWTLSAEFFHKNDKEIRAEQKKWQLRNDKLWEIRKEESKKKNAERKRKLELNNNNGKNQPAQKKKARRVSSSKGSTAAAAAAASRIHYSPSSSYDDDTNSGHHTKRTRSEKELRRIDRINEAKNKAMMQLMNAFCDIERERYLSDEDL